MGIYPKIYSNFLIRCRLRRDGTGQDLQFGRGRRPFQFEHRAIVIQAKPTGRIVSSIKKSILVDGSKTSISVEEPFWSALKEIAAIKKAPVYLLISEIAKTKETANLSSAIRLFVLNHYHAVVGTLTGR